MSPQLNPEDFLAPAWDKSIYINFAVLVQLLGVWYVLCPIWTYGPTWSYFHQLPHNGTGLGICLILLSAAQLVAIANNRPRLTGGLLFGGGFVFLTSGLILAAEGIFGHMGLQEVPPMFIIAGYKFAQSAKLRTQFKKPRK